MIRKCASFDRGSGVDNNPLRSIWMPRIMEDPLLFQATVSYAAVHLEALQGRRNQSYALEKKTKMIGMINRELRYPEMSTTNSMIGAVTLMAATEVLILCIMSCRFNH